MKTRLLVLLAASTLVAQPATPFVSFVVEANSFSAEGTWIPVDTKSHAAYQAETELDCLRSTATCVEATADYYSGHPHISTAYFQVVKWDDNGIIATNSDGICASRTLAVAFAAKHISDGRDSKALSTEDQKACKFLGVPDNEAWTMVLRGTAAWTKERDRKHMQ